MSPTSTPEASRQVPLCVAHGIFPPLIVETYETDSAFREAEILMRGFGYSIRRQSYGGRHEKTTWRITYALTGTVETLSVTPKSPSQEQVDYSNLLQRYSKLAWASSANAQRERASLGQSLMNLYVALHPQSTYTQFDDFEVVMRSGEHKGPS